MLITVLRHGEAVAPGSRPDSKRELSLRGRADVARLPGVLLQQCAQRGLTPPQCILHSPYLRTTQTAEIVKSQLDEVSCKVWQAIAPDSGTASVDRALESLAAGTDHLLLVSHQPLVSWLARHWLGAGHPVPGLSPAAFYTLELGAPAALLGEICFWASPPDYQVYAA